MLLVGSSMIFVAAQTEAEIVKESELYRASTGWRSLQDLHLNFSDHYPISIFGGKWKGAQETDK